MKKSLKLLAVVLASLVIVPNVLNAKGIEDYTTLNYRDTLKAEEMEEQFTDYKETDDQITIYLFRGQGCGYCRAFLTYMNSITEEYGKYFKMVTFEVWNDDQNWDLMTDVSNFMNNPAGGVPYIIIGDKVIPGYNERYNDTIKNAIVSEYNKDEDERYDALYEYFHQKTDVRNTTVIIWNGVFTLVGTAAVIVFVAVKFRKLENLLANKELKEEKKKHNKE